MLEKSALSHPENIGNVAGIRLVQHLVAQIGEKDQPTVVVPAKRQGVVDPPTCDQKEILALEVRSGLGTTLCQTSISDCRGCL